MRELNIVIGPLNRKMFNRSYLSFQVYFLKKPEINIDVLTFEVIVQVPRKGSLIFYGPRDYHITVLRQSTAGVGTPNLATGALISLIERAVDKQFFPLQCGHE